jgi:DNA (cytosine-5)-methyltransferase 1
MTLRVLDLFSGIGGFSLGLERAGMETVAFCEIDPFCRRVLAKHWPHVRQYDDVRALSAQQLEADGISVDVICGGFPCQDISLAGAGAGLEGARSGLWSEYRRLIEETRPRWVIIENVSALRSRGLDRVLREIAALGYDAEWHCIPASAVGAPHRRDRVWIIAWQRGGLADADRLSSSIGREIGNVARAARTLESDGEQRQRSGYAANDSSAALAYPAGEPRGIPCQSENRREALEASGCRERAALSDADGAGCSQPIGTGQEIRRTGPSEPSGSHGFGWDFWLIEPDVGRVAHGVPQRVDRLRALGNSVVPQIPEIIGRAIMASACLSA